MPLSRYRRIRNEYSLSDPQLYKVADKDDPEALLEGVAMAGVIGLLRQLGDLAQFAGEVFHDLHEEVTATASRGHTLIIRVQKLEADFPLVEKILLTQTSHTSFLYNSGVECHPNLRMDENLVTRGDLPRLVMDSYEECRGPPRLFLLDKFDVTGAGACLKRYTDPSFFKTESISNGRNSEAQREKKSRRLKNRVPRWRNCDTPESFPSSHAKLHQLFLEESLENDTEHRVKLKRRQFTGSFLDQDKKKSYMEKFVYITPPELKFSRSGPEIVDTTEVEMKPSVDNFSDKKSNENTDSGAVEVSGLNYGNDACKIEKLVNDEECADIECNSKHSVDDGFASEIDNYTDAKAIVADFYEGEGHREPQSLFSDSQSVGNSTTSEDGSNFFKGRENSSSSISANSSLAESNLAVEADDFPGSTLDIEETANVSCHTDLNIIHRPRDMEASLCKNSLPNHEVDEENSNFANLEVVDSPISPQRADTGHWSSVKHPLQDEAGQNSVVCLEILDNLSSTSDDSVYFPIIESREADIGPPISADKHMETNNTVDISPVNRHSGPECTQSLNIQEHFCEATTPNQAPLFGYVEHDKSGTVSFGNEPRSNVISGSLVGNATYLDDYGTQTIQIKSDAMIEYECSDKHRCQSKDLSHDAFQSEMPSELVITYNFVTATESNSSLDHNVENMEHMEIVYNCCKQTDVDNDLQENVMPVASSENLNAEKLKGQAVSITEECHHNEEELVCGQNSDLAMQKDKDASQYAAVNTEGNMTCISYDNPKPNSGLQDGDSKVNVLQSNEVSSQSTNCPQPSVPKPPLKSSDCTIESSRQQLVYSTNGLSGTSVAIHKVMDPRHLGGPSFPALDMLQAEPPLSLEPPPLPPLPPMQWRLGRFQNLLNKTENVPRLPRTQEHQEYSNGNSSEPPAVADVSSQDNKIGIRREDDNPSYVSAQTSMGYQNGNQTSKEVCQPSVYPPESGSLVEVRASEDCPVVVEQILNSQIESENGKPQLIPEARDQEGLSSHDELPRSSKVHNDTLQNKPVRPRNPLMDEVVAIDKSKLRKVGERAYNKPSNESKTEEIGAQLQLRKVGERVHPRIEVQYEEIESPRVQLRKVVGRTHSLVMPKTENVDSMLEQIRNKSFNLKPAVMDRPNIQGPRTNLKLAAILQKASNIRQAMAGSDEDDDRDNWSESDC